MIQTDELLLLLENARVYCNGTLKPLFRDEKGLLVTPGTKTQHAKDVGGTFKTAGHVYASIPSRTGKGPLPDPYDRSTFVLLVLELAERHGLDPSNGAIFINLGRGLERGWYVMDDRCAMDGLHGDHGGFAANTKIGSDVNDRVKALLMALAIAPGEMPKGIHSVALVG